LVLSLFDPQHLCPTPSPTSGFNTWRKHLGDYACNMSQNVEKGLATVGNMFSNTFFGWFRKERKKRKEKGKKKMSSSSSLDHLSDFHAWLQQKRDQKMSFLPWVRTLLNDETIMGMKWDDFVDPTEQARGWTPSTPSSRSFPRRRAKYQWEP